MRKNSIIINYFNHSIYIIPFHLWVRMEIKLTEIYLAAEWFRMSIIIILTYLLLITWLLIYHMLLLVTARRRPRNWRLEIELMKICFTHNNLIDLSLISWLLWRHAPLVRSARIALIATHIKFIISYIYVYQKYST